MHICVFKIIFVVVLTLGLLRLQNLKVPLRFFLQSMIQTLMHFYPIFHWHVAKKKKKCSPFNCADNFLAKSHPPRHQTTARCSTLPRSACRVDPARFQHFPSPMRHALHRADAITTHWLLCYYFREKTFAFSVSTVRITILKLKM